VISATVQVFFQMVTVRHGFCVRMVADFLQVRCVMKSQVVKRSVIVAGHKTSVSLEDAFWSGLKEISGERHMALSESIAAIDSQRQHTNLSSAIRLFVLDFYRAQVSEPKAQHNGGGHETWSSDHLRARPL